MQKQSLKIAISVSLISLGILGTADAALVSRLGGLAYYDTEADLTWLADANYAQTSGYDADGLMTWQAANDWAAQLTVGGVSGWRLGNTLQPDASCDTQTGSASLGYSCTGSEMGNLFYSVLGGSNLFINVQSSSEYWSATEYAPNNNLAWIFNMGTGSGYQTINTKSAGQFAWAVKSGDVSAVPVPAAAWLFGSGLIALVGAGRRKRSNS